MFKFFRRRALKKETVAALSFEKNLENISDDDEILGNTCKLLESIDRDMAHAAAYAAAEAFHLDINPDDLSEDDFEFFKAIGYAAYLFLQGWRPPEEDMDFGDDADFDDVEFNEKYSSPEVALQEAPL
ncbi:hypothetical protein IKG12_01565 [Candidatus Saccharibacteria bacterium]|nr:hypothetical protein [Candidatus Saccharibacteria bacterium]